LLLAGTPVLARPRINPASPGLDTPPPVVMPNGAYVGQPILVVPWRDNCKNTGAANSCTPDPTRNTPGAEAKS
jgi:hypothetical protein